MDDAFNTLANPETAEIKIKGSRFIGYAESVTEQTAAEAVIDRIRKKHHDATHNCSAYRIGHGDRVVFRASDDGEPSGTAGKPILEAIEGRDLTNTVCVVTRYFGGTKLGTGGLARAYGECAGTVLDGAGRKKEYFFSTIRIAFDYALTGIVMNLVSTYEGRIQDTKYGEKTEMNIALRRSRKEAFLKDILDSTSGQAAILAGEAGH